MLDLSSSSGFIFPTVIPEPFKVFRRIEKYSPLVLVNCKSVCRREEKNAGCVFVSLLPSSQCNRSLIFTFVVRDWQPGWQSQVRTKHILQPNITIQWCWMIYTIFPFVRDQMVVRYRHYCVFLLGNDLHFWYKILSSPSLVLSNACLPASPLNNTLIISPSSPAFPAPSVCSVSVAVWGVTCPVYFSSFGLKEGGEWIRWPWAPALHDNEDVLVLIAQANLNLIQSSLGVPCLDILQECWLSSERQRGETEL